jgi:hypothetical protein
VEEQRVNVSSISSIRESAFINDAFRVEVRIVVWEKPDVLAVPTANCSGPRATGPCSWAAASFLARRQMANGTGRSTEVLEGLAAGDNVVAYQGNAQGWLENKSRSGSKIKR